MFDLSKEITKWRKALLERQTYHISDMDELESHLRDEIDQLKIKGLSEQEAFMVGTHRLGEPDALADEFAKVNGALWLRKKLFYAACGIFAYVTANCAAEAFKSGLVLLATTFGLRGYAAGILGLVAWIAAFGMTIFLCYSVVRTRDLDGEKFSRAADSLKGKVVLLTIAIFLMLVASLSIIIPAAVVHMVGINQYGPVMLPTQMAKLLWPIAPVIWMVILIYLRPAKYTKFA